jgi:hypothetical protein
MYVYRITADAAFELLIWRSQDSNVKIRALAEQVLADIQSIKYDEDLYCRVRRSTNSS